MKKYFFTGLICLLPVVITLYVVLWILDLFTEPFMGIAKSLLHFYQESRGLPPHHHEAIALFISRICILVILVIFIFVLGVLCQKITKKFTLNIFYKIPLIPSIYRISKEVTKALVSPEGKTFKESVLVPFPKENTYALGLVTGEVPLPFKDKKIELEVTVFVPTAPHPLSGYLLLTPKKETLPVNLSTEEVFKFLLAAGAVTPEDAPKEES